MDRRRSRLAGKVETLYRWRAVATYRTENGPVDLIHSFEELAELEEKIENGPDWNTLEKIVVTLGRVSNPGLTVEESFRI